MAGQEGQLPSKETIAARESLKHGITRLLDRRWGISLPQVLNTRSFVNITLTYEDTRRTREIPEPLVRFTKEHFPQRLLDIETIEVQYGLTDVRNKEGRVTGTAPTGYVDIGVSHIYPRSDEEAELERRRVVVGQDEITGLPATEGIAALESQTDFKYVILPDANFVAHPHISIFPFETPIVWRMSGYALQDWLSNREEAMRQPSAKERLEEQLSATQQITDPYKIGLDTGKHRGIYRIPEVRSGTLEQAELIHIVAGLLPDLPEDRAYKTTNEPFLGSRRQRIAEPHKTLNIH